MIHTVYNYDHVMEVILLDDIFCSFKDSGPMVKTTLKTHKGIDNTLIFRALGPDRVPIKFHCDQQVYARVVDPDNRKVVLEKKCQLGPSKGLITLRLDAGDLVDVHVGVYEFVLIRTEDFISDVVDYYVEKPLYTDFTGNLSMTIEVTEQAFKAPQQSVTLLPKDWTPDILATSLTQPRPCFYSPRIPGSRVQNHKDSVHTFSTYTTNFTGILEIWGTLEETPAPYLDANRWFKIYPSTMSQDIRYVNYTGTQAWTFSANVLWIKFRYFPSQEVLDPGVMQKVIVRT